MCNMFKILTPLSFMINVKSTNETVIFSDFCFLVLCVLAGPKVQWPVGLRLKKRGRKPFGVELLTPL